MFKQYLKMFIIMFINVILVYFRNDEEHANYLRIVLQTLKDRELYAKFSKGEFHLAYELCSYDILYLTKVFLLICRNRGSKELTQTYISNDTRKILDLAGYNTRFLEGFSSISSQLTKLTQKKAKFQWFNAYEKSFDELKTKLTTALVLSIENRGFCHLL